jgi:O-antigen ligase
MNKVVLKVFAVLVFLTLLTPLWVFSELQFPFITSKAFFFRIAIELAVPMYIFLLLSRKNLRPKLKNPLNIVVLLFLAINIITSFLGVNPMRSLWGNFERMGGTFYLAHLVFLFFYIQLLGQAGGVYLKRFLQAFVGVATLLALNGLSGLVHGPILTTDPSLPDRISSTFGNPIFFASFLIVPLFLAIYFALSEEKRIWKTIFAVSGVLQLIGIYFSGTRGAIVGLLAGVFLGGAAYASFAKKVKLRKYGLIILGVLVVVFGSLFIFRDKLPQTSILSRVANFNDSNTKARLIQWEMAYEGFKDKPLLGVGPENYYFIDNQHYNPEIVKYDKSWFDKPHNFLLEVLSTNGIFGFLAYGSMFILALYGLWKAYKNEFIGLLEMCVLLGGIITYQVQNLFVFDTVSASVAFYIFLGLMSYMWSESKNLDGSKALDKFEKNSDWKIAVLAISALLMLYVVYISNIMSLEAAKRVNFGYSYSEFNPEKAAEYFKSAFAVSYNLDPRETANRYSDFAATIVSSNLVNDKPDFVKEKLNLATEFQRAITEKTKNDPVLFMRLAVDEMNLAQIKKQSIDSSLATIDRAIALSPKRVEIYQVKLQIVGSQKNWPEALPIGQKIVELNPYNSDLRWQLAMLYFLNDRIEEAVKAGDEALAAGFRFTKLQQFAWYIQYYQVKGDFGKVAPLLEKAVELEPQEIGLYVDLAKTYAKLGNFEKARVLAEQVMKSDPSQKAAMQAFIKTLE